MWYYARFCFLLGLPVLFQKNIAFNYVEDEKIDQNKINWHYGEQN